MKLNDLKLMFINKWLGHNLGFTQDRNADLEVIADWWIAEFVKEIEKHRISSNFAGHRLNMLKGLGGNEIYNKALDDIKS